MATKSSKKVLFTKMVAIGNDSIIINGMKNSLQSPPHFAKKICNRWTGVGADQMIMLGKSRKADFSMRTFNADGSEAEMCGNGIRALALYIKQENLSQKKTLQIETVSGIKTVTTSSKQIEIDMGEPLMKGEDVPVNFSGRVVNRPLKVESKDFRITCLSVGNPHCIIFQDNLDNFDIEKYGPLIETSSIFPKRVNVSFVNVFGKDEVHLRVWERGVGETQGCGTAACAATVAGVLNGLTDRDVIVHQKGGKVNVVWDQKNNHIHLIGAAERVCNGEFYL